MVVAKKQTRIGFGRGGVAFEPLCLPHPSAQPLLPNPTPLTLTCARLTSIPECSVVIPVVGGEVWERESREGRGVEPPEKWRAPSSNSGSTHLPRSCSPAPLGLSTTPSWSASQSLELIPHLGHTSQRHVVSECRHNMHTPWPAVVKILLSSGVWRHVVWWKFALCFKRTCCLRLRERCSTFLRNVDVFLPDFMLSHPTRQWNKVKCQLDATR